jgi:triosephosphate isomerase
MVKPNEERPDGLPLPGAATIKPGWRVLQRGNALRQRAWRDIAQFSLAEGADWMGLRERALIAGNWKMHGVQSDGLALARGIAARATAGMPAEILICPPATLLVSLAGVLAKGGVALGAQDCHAAPAGAFTGDLSAPMLKDAGCSHVIVGHSERRAGHGETDAVVRAKATAALEAGLVAILCVGETEAQNEAGQGAEVVAAQLRDSIPAAASPATLVVAYEPVWAIGTGRTPGLADIDRMHCHIRTALGTQMAGGALVRLLYGGSVKPANAAEILARPDVDGALVGGASLKIEEFWTIIDAAPRR